MKRKHITLRTGSLILVVLLCFIFTTTPAFAAKLNTKNKIDPVLAEVMSEFSNTDLVPLSIWFYDIDESVLADNTLDEVDMLVSDKKLPYYSIDTIDQDTAKIDVSNTDLSVEQIQLISVAKRDSSKVIYTHHNELILNDIVNDLERYNIIYCCSYAPNIVLEIQKSEIHKLEENVNVSDIYYYDEEALDTDLSNSKTTSSDIDLEDCCEFIELYDSLTGQGINVGMIESGWINHKALPIKNVTDHLFQNKSNSTGGTNYTTGHETGVASMLIGDCTEAGYDFKGMIPDSTLYHTSTKVNGGWKAGVEWLIENGVNVINVSSTLISQRYNSSSDASRWLDHIAYQHNITVVVAVGYLTSPVDPNSTNISPFAYSNNIIIVGAIQLEKDNYGEYVISEYINSAYSSSGRYFPHVVASGTTGIIPGVTGPDPMQQITGNSGATPQVTATVVQLMQLEPSLITNPTLVRSLVMAGATGDKFCEIIDTTGTDMDRELGAGVVNARRSAMCLHITTVNNGDLPKTYSTFYQSGDLSQRTIPLNVYYKGKVRMALNWQSKCLFDSDGNHIDDEGVLTSSLSCFKISVASPKGEVYTSFDVHNPFQLLVFDVPKDDLGIYTVTISRHGISGYETPVSLAVYGADLLV